MKVASRLRLRRLDRRLDRIWRQGAGGPRPVRAANADRLDIPRVGADAATDPVCVAEIAWLDGFSARLGLCHPGAVADLARLLDDGRVVTLSRAVYSGQAWSLDFALGNRPFPLLAGRQHRTGRRRSPADHAPGAQDA